MQEIRVLLEGLNSREWTVRSRTMASLQRYPEECYLPFLEGALKDHVNDVLRNASMDFYRTLGGRSLPSLLGLLKDDDPEARLFAANLLGDIADGRASVALIASLKDPDENVRVAAAEALGKIGDPQAVNALIGSLGDEPWVAMSSINALGRLGGEEALSALYGCLEKEEYRGIAFDAIESAGNEDTVRRLTPFVLRDEMRDLALKSVVNISIRLAIKPLPDFFINVIPLLVDLQSSSHPDIRRAAFIALAWAEDLRGLPYYVEALSDDSLQEYAVKGLVAMGGRAAPEIIDALRDTEAPNRCALAKILAMMGEEMALMQFCDDPDPEVRVEVALALESVFRQIRSPRVFEILEKMLRDSEEEVRMAAERTLAALGEAK